MGLDQTARQLYYRVLRPGGVVKLPSGFYIQVRRLTLYELDNVQFNDQGQFTYTYELSGGKTKEAFYDISQWPEPPRAPAVPEQACDTLSMEASLWKVYNLYQSALLHRIKQVEAAENYAHSVARYILAHCVKDVDRALVNNAEAYELVYGAAICPEVSLTDIETALAQTFKASFDGQPILDQLLKDKGGSSASSGHGSGKVDALRQWAGQARQSWQLTKEKWAEFSLKERAEMVVSLKLPDWLSALEWQKKEREK